MVDLRKKIRSGMIAATIGEKYLVLTDCETKFYGSQSICFINNTGFMIGSDYDKNLSSDNEYSINALYKPTVDGGTYSMEYKNRDLIWTRYPKNLKELIISRRFSK